ncbi:MAG TPA: hypothetical protein VHC70_11135 [Phycisphaerales bacterium]|nr:hypothetical protein [Phycisphaerales bacterium]
MKPHPRIRKTIKWGGVAVTLLLVAVWIGSGWASIGWSCVFRKATVRHGLICLMWTRDMPVDFGGQWGVIMQGPNHWDEHPRAWAFDWGGHFFYHSPNGDWVAEFPVWPVAALLLMVTALAWHFDTLARRRERVGRCPNCNYDRAGLAAGAVCPECGSGSGGAGGASVTKPS